LRKSISLFLVAMCACSSAPDSTTPGDDDSSDQGGGGKGTTFERTIVIDGQFLVDGTLELELRGDSFDFSIESANIPVKREGFADGKGIALVDHRGKFSDGDCELTFDVSSSMVFVQQTGACSSLAPDQVSFAGFYSQAPNKIATMVERTENAQGEPVDDGVLTLLSESETHYRFDLFNTFGAIEGEFDMEEGGVAGFNPEPDCSLRFESLSNVMHITQTGACSKHGEEGFSLSGIYSRE